MLTADQILKLKHHADKEQRTIYESFKKKIMNDPQRESILGCFCYPTINTLHLMEVYVRDVLSSNEFNYMVAMFDNISIACIQAFIDGMTLDDADWAATISKGNKYILEEVFYLITNGYSKEQITTFVEARYKLQLCEKHFDWHTVNLYDVVKSYSTISAEEIECCAMLIEQKRVDHSNTKLFVKLLKLEVDTSNLKSFFTHVDTCDYTDEEIIEAFLDFKLLSGN